MPPDPPPHEPAGPDEAAALFAMAIDSAGEHPGDRIGSCTLMEIIGDGGFGRVWLAEQTEPVRRKVALKILKPGMDTDEVVSRFRQEWKALALMEHPGIARVFEAGVTPAGRPYFTMELVHGQPINEYCDTHGLPLEARLRLFIKVCHAVQHAHQKGLIHRDLKPSNILVCEEDGEPAPRIIDFGVARALEQPANERSFVTRLHQVIGTPGYMSPEQAEREDGGDLDTRTDIYSLGVVLYEILTGTLPFASDDLAHAALDAVLRQVREATPPQPSRRITSLHAERATAIARHRGIPPERLRAALRGDLDWITLKCLEKDRQRRYESVGALADDLRLHLENRPVNARPPEAAYLLGRAIRRHRLAFGLGALTLAALLAGVCFSTVFFLRERSARLQSEAMRREAEAARLAATRARGSAEDLISWSLNDLRHKLIPIGKLELLDDIGASAEAYYRNLPPAERNAASEIRRARVLLIRGDVLFQRNELPKAAVLYQDGIAIMEALAAAGPPDDEQRKWHDILLSRMGDALRSGGKPAESLAVRQREIVLARTLAAKAPDDPQIQHNLCVSLRKLAECQRDVGQFVEARRTLRKCIALGRAKAPGSLPISLLVLADWDRVANEYEAALKSYQEAVVRFGEVFANAPDNVKELRYLVQTHFGAMSCHIRLGNLDEARKELEAARELRERLARIDPTNRDLHGDLGCWMMFSGSLHLAENDGERAVGDFREALRIFEGLSRGDPGYIFWQGGLEQLARVSAPLVSKPDAPVPVLLFAADLQLTIAERRNANDRKGPAASALAEARPFLDSLKRVASTDPAVPELNRRAEALRMAIGDAR